MPRTNQAAWLPGPNEKLEIRPSELVKPGPGQVLVKNRAVSINPVDWKFQDGYSPTGKPRIMGQDVAGEVVEVGDGVTDFCVGQRVLAHVVGLATGRPQDSAFQEFSVAPALSTCPIPDDVSFEQATVLPLAISTAAHGLFSSEYLALPLPRHNVQGSTGNKALLVWGAASSVSCVAVQLAVAAGVKVVATASKKNFALCKDLGASEVFDYNSPSVVGDLTAALQKYDLIGAYDGKQFWATFLFHHVPSWDPRWDPRDMLTILHPQAISTRDTQLNTAQVLAQLGGGTLAITLRPADEIPATVTVKPGMSTLNYYFLSSNTPLGSN